MKTRTRILLAAGMAIVLATVTASLLLSGYVAAAIWFEGPYFPLTRLLPGSVDTLWTMVAIVAGYYFIAALVALGCSSRRAVAIVVVIVLALNTLGACLWHRQAGGSPAGTEPTALTTACRGGHAGPPLMPRPGITGVA